MSLRVSSTIEDSRHLFKKHVLRMQFQDTSNPRSQVHRSANTQISTNMRVVDEVTANAWRVETLRLLDPPESENSSIIRQDAKSLVAKAAKVVAESIIASASGLLIDSSQNQKAVIDLAKITNQAAEHAFGMWTQKTNVQILDHVGLQNSLPPDQPFSGCTDMLEEHPRHRHKLASDENALDSLKIRLVSSPAVVLHGNGDGEDYSADTRWILKKAVVWLE